MPTPLEQIFATAQDPLAVQNRLVAEAQDRAAQMETPGEKIGFALGSLGASLFKKFRSGEKGKGLAHRIRTGTDEPPELLQSRYTNEALDNAVLSAGGQREGEHPEDHAQRQVEAAWKHLNALDPSQVDSKTLQQVAGARPMLAAQAEEARAAREETADENTARDLQVANVQNSLSRAIANDTANYLVDPDTQQVIKMVDPANSEDVATVQQAVQADPRLRAMTREEIIAMDSDILSASLANARRSLQPTARKFLEQATAQNRALELGASIAETMILTPEGLSSRTLGGTIERFGNALSTQLSSLGILGPDESDLGLVTMDPFTGETADFAGVFNNHLTAANGTWREDMFDAEIANVQLFSMGQNLAYAIARANDPSGRLSDFDVQQSAKIVGLMVKDPRAAAAALKSALGANIRHLNSSVEDLRIDLNLPDLGRATMASMQEHGRRLDAALERIPGFSGRTNSLLLGPGGVQNPATEEEKLEEGFANDQGTGNLYEGFSVAE